MLGVILWKDQDTGNAVIWCEDRGDLAYLEGTDQQIYTEHPGFDTGDFVEFDINEVGDTRRARNALAIVFEDRPTPAHHRCHSLESVCNAPAHGSMGQVIQLSDYMTNKDCPVCGAIRLG